MKNSPHQTTDKLTDQCVVPVVIATPIINGVVGGISSVITAYLFRPVWNKITRLWDKKESV